MAEIILTEDYQTIASGTKSFTAGDYSQTAKQIVYARYDSIDPDTKSAVIQVKVTVKSNKSGYSWTSSGNTQSVTLDGTKKTKSVNVGTVTTTEKTTFEDTFTVYYGDDGTYEDKTLKTSIDVYSSYVVSAEGTVSLPKLELSKVHIGHNNSVKNGVAYVGVNGVPVKGIAYIGVNGIPVKGI